MQEGLLFRNSCAQEFMVLGSGTVDCVNSTGGDSSKILGKSNFQIRLNSIPRMDSLELSSDLHVYVVVFMYNTINNKKN